MEIIKVGLAAYGMSGQVFHAPFISTNPHFELCKIVERSKELSKERYPDATIVRSFEELIKDPAIELIVVNTPDSTHYEYARLALEAGKHVIVEKPFTSTTEEGEELIALAAEKGLMLSVYQNRRWDADFRTVQEIISKGLLGRLVEYESTFARYRNFIKPNTWKETGESGGGLTYNLGSHLIDQAIRLFGMPEAVFADIATMRTQPHWGEETEEEWGLIHTEIGGEEICRKYPGISGNYGGFYQNIYEHLRLGEALQTGARDILNVIRVIEAAYQSQQEGKVISLK